MKLHTLIEDYKNDKVSFEDVLTVIPTLTWGERVEDPDGAVDWVGDNSVAELDNYVLEGVLTVAEREEIVKVIR